MKSAPLEKYLETSCKDCVFAIYDGKTQTSCYADRISKFANVTEAYDEDKEFYVINHVCNYHTTESIENNIEDTLSKVKKDKRMKVDVFIDIYDDNKEYIDKLKLFYNNLSEDDKKSTYYHIFCHKITDELNSFVDNIENLKVFTLEITAKKFNKKFMKNFKNSFSLKIDSISNIPSDGFIERVNFQINEQLVRGIVFEDSTTNAKIYSNYGMVYEYHNCVATSDQSVFYYEDIANLLIKSATDKQMIYSI